ncbi:hypothetical protein J7E73_22610 [Paenibacillus albidus]|nr:hypothetical protein [Paenibacillus albidus]
MVHLRVCKQKEDIELYTHYMLSNRARLHLGMDHRLMFLLLSAQFQHGEMLIALNEDHRVVGAAGYCYGTADQHFANKETVMVDRVYLDEDRRGSRLFVQGLQVLAELLEQSTVQVTNIQFYVPEQDMRICRLCDRFANRVLKLRTPAGVDVLYLATPESLSSYSRTPLGSP